MRIEWYWFSDRYFITLVHLDWLESNARHPPFPIPSPYPSAASSFFPFAKAVPRVQLMQNDTYISNNRTYKKAREGAKAHITLRSIPSPIQNYSLPHSQSVTQSLSSPAHLVANRAITPQQKGEKISSIKIKNSQGSHFSPPFKAPCLLTYHKQTVIVSYPIIS